LLQQIVHILNVHLNGAAGERDQVLGHQQLKGGELIAQQHPDGN